jgi:hypothetical protein
LGGFPICVGEPVERDDDRCRIKRLQASFHTLANASEQTEVRQSFCAFV